VIARRLTYHLTPKAWWHAADQDAPLPSPSLASEGFTHCTDGAAEMVATANRHYAAVSGAFVIVTVDLDRVTSAWRVEDPGRIYPHIFGPIDRAAIVAVIDAPRAADGTFLPFDA
jgi:uncharacterized protein (DUF952 family)